MATVEDKARPWIKTDRQLTENGDSWNRLVTVTPSDVTIFSPRLQALYVTGTGTLVIENSNLDQVTITAADNTWHYLEVRRVLAASTATGVVGAS